MKTKTAPWDYDRRLRPAKPQVRARERAIGQWTDECLRWLGRGLITQAEFYHLIDRGPQTT